MSNITEPHDSLRCYIVGKRETNMDFEKLVIEKSHEVPVLVDFWAPWCSPCQALGPIITGLAEEANGRWILEKVNTDEQPELMQRFGIRGIPAVKLFHEGEVIAEFTGMKPRHHLEYWLEQCLPDARMEELDQIRQDAAALEAFIARHEDMAEAKLALIRLLLFSDPQRCAELAASIPTNAKYMDELESLKTLAAHLSWTSEENRPVALKLKAAQEAAYVQDHQQAVSLLIEAVMMDKSFAEELARRTCIAYFHYLGADHEVTKALRRRFDMALY